MSTLNDLRNARIEKLEKLKSLGINPFPAKTERNTKVESITRDYAAFENKENICLTGRMFSLREHGSVVFGNIKDDSGELQLYIRKDTLTETDAKRNTLGFTHINLLDVGDFVEATGTITKTKTGEISLLVKNLKIISKAVRPFPSKWNGIKDTEIRYRKRYLDLLLNENAKKLLDTRWEVEKETRKFLWNEQFVEVETPIFQGLYGGTNAEPFTTHFNALDCDFYLRIAPELYLKRLIVGGYERVFEIARNFRNEGIDQTHFPEFTMLEWYEAYADYHRVMDLAEALAKHLVKTLTKGTKIQVGENEIEIGQEWPRIPVEDLLKKHMGIDWEMIDEKTVKEIQNKHKVHTKGAWSKNKALFDIFDHVIAPTLLDPIWVIDYPTEVSPLSKAHRSKKGRAERFEGYIGGVEIFDGWSEIVSGIEQRERFETEQKNMQEGDAEAMPLDESFIEALEYGCPPLGGIGFGIDRLVMFLTNTWSIKEIVSFPILKPEKQAGDKTPRVTERPKEEKSYNLPSRETAMEQLAEHVKDAYQVLHAKMVANVMEAYAEKLEANKDLWYITGLLHDIDYCEHPNKHPEISLGWLKEWGYPEEIIHAVQAHGIYEPRIEPKTQLSAALIAVDELTGLLYAYSLMRPNKWEGMKASSIKKKFKDKAFAAKIDRKEIQYGMDKFNVELGGHALFLINILKDMPELK
jgi:lysyl-tRNA synthetase, class II